MTVEHCANGRTMLTLLPTYIVASHSKVALDLLPPPPGNKHYLSLLLGSWSEQHHQYWLEGTLPLGWALGQVLHKERGGVAQSCSGCELSTSDTQSMKQAGLT